jgi:hypothetical protein
LEGDTGLPHRADRGSNPTTHMPLASLSQSQREEVACHSDFSVFGKMNAKYIPIYVAEFQFRYNNREYEGISGTAIIGCKD